MKGTTYRRTGSEPCYAVMRVACAMQLKLNKNADKPDRSQAYLIPRLLDEVAELLRELEDPDATPESILNEVADVCNFAMMLGDTR